MMLLRSSSHSVARTSQLAGSRRPIRVIAAVRKNDATNLNTTAIDRAEPMASWQLGVPAMLVSALAPAMAAKAEEEAAAVTGPGGLGAGEVALLLAPIVLYGAFNVYRERFNPKATFLDFVYLLVFFAILGNGISIVAFKTRWF